MTQELQRFVGLGVCVPWISALGTTPPCSCLTAPASPRRPGGPEVHLPRGDHGRTRGCCQAPGPAEPLPGAGLVRHAHRALAQQLPRQPGRDNSRGTPLTLPASPQHWSGTKIASQAVPGFELPSGVIGARSRPCCDLRGEGECAAGGVRAASGDAAQLLNDFSIIVQPYEAC